MEEQKIKLDHEYNKQGLEVVNNVVEKVKHLAEQKAILAELEKVTATIKESVKPTTATFTL